MENKVKEIRCQGKKVHMRVENLMCRVNEKTLFNQHLKQKSHKAVGVDGVDKLAYDVGADKRIKELVERMKTFSYRPQPVRRTYIPKANGYVKSFVM